MTTYNDGISLRAARPGDAAQLSAIYRPYVLHTAISFEYEAPSADEFRTRIERTLAHYPYIVAERAGEALGYAYASPLHPRAAYAWAAESTVYIKEDAHARGLGKRLCLALEDELRRMNIVSLNACIAVPRTTDDPYLTENSWKFHEHIGYRLAGRFHQCAYKFDRWYDMIWMEKDLAAHETPPQRVKPWRGFL